MARRLLGAAGAEGNREYGLLKRVFDERYETVRSPGGGKKERARPQDKSEIRGRSVQNPHDPDSGTGTRAKPR